MEDWILCSERLPKPFTPILITQRLESGPPENLVGYSVCHGMYLGDDEWRGIQKSGKVKVSVVAWMPMPKPYIEG